MAPTTFQPVIRAEKETGDRELALMRWGLVPFFTKQLSDVKGLSTINARAESIKKAAAWRTPFKKRRCLIPADGFYEWRRVDPKNKEPFSFGLADDAPFAFAFMASDSAHSRSHFIPGCDSGVVKHQHTFSAFLSSAAAVKLKLSSSTVTTSTTMNLSCMMAYW